jgi:hypothetical protein
MIHQNDYRGKPYIVVDGVYFNRADIINYICYVRGHAHLAFLDLTFIK